MTDNEYFVKKKQMCSNFSFCSSKCPLFRYQDERGIHACECLCDVLEQTDFDRAKELLTAFFET